MSELLQIRSRGLVISQVEPNSPAERAGLRPEDVIRKVNNQSVDDIIDFRFHTSEEQCELTFVREGIYETIELEREWGEDLGITFSFELADQIHTCDNKCVFCFIHQMPKGMRKTLYLMDDDFRLSFLHGNYVTLTNMSEEEFSRTKEQGLSPLYVSVHATDPRLRGFMLGRGQPEPILPRLKDLIDAGISVHCQVVLCPGLNDGKSLDNTIDELSKLHSAITGKHAGVLSVAVVPVGLTKFRHNLYPVQKVTPEYSQKFLKQIGTWHKKLKNQLGTRFVFPTDEWYFYAEKPVPSRSFYEDFPQFEDGVGTCRLFLEQAKQGYKSLPQKIGKTTHLTLVTGLLPARVIADFAKTLSKIDNLKVDVCVVVNHFFGDGITIAGLLTGQDVISALMQHKPKGLVAIPDITLKDDFLFLDNLTMDDVRSKTGFDVRVCPCRAKEFLKTWLPKNVY